jgi:hypothetical protein
MRAAAQHEAAETSMAADGKVPVIAAAKAGYDFLRAHWRAYLSGAGVCGALQGALYAAQMVYIRDGGGQFPLFAGALVATLLATIFLQAACMRHATRDEPPGALALETGAPAFRLLGVSLQITFFLVLAFLPVFLAFSVAMGVLFSVRGIDPTALNAQDPNAIIAALGPGGVLAMAVIGLALLAPVLWFYARLILASPATIAEGRMMAFQTWKWTKGNGWRCLAGVLLVSVPLGIAVAIISSIVQGVAGTPLDNPAAAIKDGELTRPLWLFWAVGALQGFLNTLLVAVASSGVLAYLYRGLRPAAQTITIA